MSQANQVTGTGGALVVEGLESASRCGNCTPPSRPAAADDAQLGSSMFGAFSGGNMKMCAEIFLRLTLISKKRF